MEDKYTKVVYQSEPIGKERIVLYLTTFDLEAFEKDQKLTKIPEQKKAMCCQFDRSELNNPDFMQKMDEKLQNFVKETYQNQLENMKTYIEMNRVIPKAQWYKVD